MGTPSKPDGASAQGNASLDDKRLAEFVAEHRQHLPQPARRIEASGYRLTPEQEAAAHARERKAAERAELRRKAEILLRFKSMVFAAGSRYEDCTLGNFVCREPQQRKVVTALREYVAADSPEGVILFGPVGTGKDHLAFAVCREAVRAGKSVAWINGQKWFGLIRDAMDTDKSEAAIIADLSRPELLCLSDPLPPVGALTQFQATMLYRLVDARYARGVPTICTINVANDAEADERMGAATWDRLTHGAWKLHCAWPTYRKPAREI